MDPLFAPGSPRRGEQPRTRRRASGSGTSHSLQAAGRTGSTVRARPGGRRSGRSSTPSQSSAVNRPSTAISWRNERRSSSSDAKTSCSGTRRRSGDRTPNSRTARLGSSTLAARTRPEQGWPASPRCAHERLDLLFTEFHRQRSTSSSRASATVNASSLARTSVSLPSARRRARRAPDPRRGRDQPRVRREALERIVDRRQTVRSVTVCKSSSTITTGSRTPPGRS